MTEDEVLDIVMMAMKRGWTLRQAVIYAYREGRKDRPRAGRVGLTPHQRELLAFIRSHCAANGYPPSFDEMRQGTGLKNKSGVHRLIVSLEERGHIARLPNRARAIEVLDEAAA